MPSTETVFWRVATRRSIFYFGAIVVASFVIFALSPDLPLDKIGEFSATRLGAAEFSKRLIRQPATAMRIGNYYFNSGAYDLDAALAYYNLALELDPGTPKANYQIARINFLKGYLYSALLYVEEELKVNPALPNSYYVRGLIQGYMGEYKHAAEDFRKFVELVPGQWAGYNDLAWVEVKAGNFSAAKEAVERAFAREPNWKETNPWLWSSLGTALLNTKQYAEAVSAFHSAFEIAEKVTPEWFWSAYPGNNPKEARGSLNQFMATLYFNLGVSYEKQGKYAEAKGYYEKYLAALDKPKPQLIAETETRVRALDYIIKK